MKRSTQARIKRVIYDLWDKGYRSTPVKSALTRSKTDVDALTEEGLTKLIESKSPEEWQKLAQKKSRSRWRNSKTIAIRVPKIFADRLLQVAHEWDKET